MFKEGIDDYATGVTSDEILYDDNYSLEDSEPVVLNDRFNQNEGIEDDSFGEDEIPLIDIKKETTTTKDVPEESNTSDDEFNIRTVFKINTLKYNMFRSKIRISESDLIFRPVSHGHL